VAAFVAIAVIAALALWVRDRYSDALSGTSWRVVSVAESGHAPTEATRAATISFGHFGSASWNDSFNVDKGTYSIDADALTLKAGTTSTAGVPKHAAVVSAMDAMVAGPTTYERDGDQLVVRADPWTITFAAR
jgi:hypothetical protein